MKEKLKALFGKKSVRIVLVLLVALALLLAVRYVFFPQGEAEETYRATEEEERLSELLSKIEGVKSASVMIASKEGDTVGAVIVFCGEDGILVRTRLIEAAARALGIENRDVHVYPANAN